MNTEQVTGTPTINLEFSLDELRVLAKSVSKTREAELKKLARLAPGSHLHKEVKADFQIVDRIDGEISYAIAELVAR